jgi:hypothetical protein
MVTIARETFIGSVDGRGVSSFPEMGRCKVNGVGACFICTLKLSTSPILRQSSVRMLMKILSRHRVLTQVRRCRSKFDAIVRRQERMVSP